MIRFIGTKKSKFHAFVDGDILDLHFDKDHGHYHSSGNVKMVWPELKRLGFNKSHIVEEFA